MRTPGASAAFNTRWENTALTPMTLLAVVNVRLDQQPSRIGDGNELPRSKTAKSPGLLVEAVGHGESIALPGQLELHARIVDCHVRQHHVVRKVTKLVGILFSGPDCPLHFALHERAKTGLEQFQCLADPFVIGDGQ